MSDSTEIAVLQTKVQGLREFTRDRFEQVEAQLGRLQEALDSLTAVAITKPRFQEQVDSTTRAHRRIDAHGQKLTRYDQVTRLLNVIWGILGAIIVAVLVALATGRAQIIWK